MIIMKFRILILQIAIYLIIVSCTSNKKYDWEIAENPLLTEWSESVDPAQPWPEYPRPLMKRSKWPVGIYHYSQE
jgi:hypothetical protein